ncbi:AhpC/TSA antioxidant enzyme-domain-containing protein [Coprinopsis sp. MPI-PUGE-AT-0042]|nr:AhpC/TSA antioxidant enzyme-domain-containing protein [Coprinopsis sp. MPI-PUGE-AT-0042]
MAIHGGGSKLEVDKRLAASHRQVPGNGEVGGSGRRRPTTSQGKAAISPPIATSLVWESQATARKFVSIASNPIYSNAGTVQQVSAQRSNFTAVVDTPRRTGSSANSPSPLTSPGCRNRARSPSSLTTITPPQQSRLETMSRRSSVQSETFRRSASVQITDDGPIEGPLSESSNPKPRASVQFSPLTHSQHRLPACHNPLATSTPSTETSFSTGLVTQDEAKEQLNTVQGKPSEQSKPPVPACENVQGIPGIERRGHGRSPILSIASSTPHSEWSLPTVSQLAYAASLPIFRSDGTSIRFGSLFEEHRTIVLFVRHFFCPASQNYVSSLISLVRQPAFKAGGVMCDFNPYDAKLQQGEEDRPPKQVQLVLIGCGKPGLVEKYREIFELPFRMFTDPDGKLYECLGMGNGRVSGKKRSDGRTGAPECSSPGSWEGPGPMARVEPVQPQSKAKEKSQKGTKLGLMKGLAVVMLRALKVGMPVWENGGDMSQLGGEFILGPGLTCTYAHRMQTPDGHAPIVDVLVAADVDIPEASSTQHLPPTKKTSSTEKKVLKRRKSSREPPRVGPANSSTLPGSQSNNPTHHRPSGPQAEPAHDPRSSQGPHSFISGPALPAHRTLRSMGSATFARFDSSQESLGTRTIAGLNAASEFPVYAAELDARLETPGPSEDRWMDWRQGELDRLRVRKDTRRALGTSFVGSELSLRIPEEEGSGEQQFSGGGYHRYAHPNPLRYKSGAASLSSLGNVGAVVPLPPLPGPPLAAAPIAQKPAKLQTKRSKAGSISASVRNLVLGRE